MTPTLAPDPDDSPPSPGRRRRGARALAVAGLMGVSAVAGGVASMSMSAGAATTSTTSPASSGSSADTPGMPPPGCAAARLPLSGTVTAVGTSSVTIATSSGTTTYAVDSSSDIDKNGEATLSDLTAGDTVRFSTTSVNGTVTIDKLHAGTESLDRPAPGATPPTSSPATIPPADG
ncbi:MAG TPA: hypothetical protein VE991_01440 [Acidimicrobiales bacterium]|nr:hypothetical protein [Acidimicrobiales bacterium]